MAFERASTAYQRAKQRVAMTEKRLEAGAKFDEQLQRNLNLVCEARGKGEGETTQNRRISQLRFTGHRRGDQSLQSEGAGRLHPSGQDAGRFYSLAVCSASFVDRSLLISVTGVFGGRRKADGHYQGPETRHSKGQSLFYLQGRA